MKQSVAIVGSGITSLMTALELFEAWFDVSVYTKWPDPRRDQNAEQYGSTWNGRMGRFITWFEGETYLSDTPMYPDMPWAFSHHISEGWWLSRDISQYSLDDQEWLKKRYEASKNQERVREIFENYYVENNRKSIQLWKDMYEKRGNLFQNTDITNPYAWVLRIYDNDRLFEATTLSHKKYWFLKEQLTKKEVIKRYPVYEQAEKNGLIAWWIIAEGFSLNILAFCENIISYLEKMWVKFYWNTWVKKIEIEKDIVVWLKTDDWIITAQNYSVNPGAYDNNLLSNTPAKNVLWWVAGRWIIMPRPIGYNTPTKIHGDKRLWFPVTDNNLTPFSLNGKDLIAVGWGYLYIGSNAEEFSNIPEYALLDSENERTIKLYLGEYYTKAKEAWETYIWKNSCVRSFSYNDEPVHCVMPTVNWGSLTITAGTNTGTATLAPYLARWTKSVFEQNS